MWLRQFMDGEEASAPQLRASAEAVTALI